MSEDEEQRCFGWANAMLVDDAEVFEDADSSPVASFTSVPSQSTPDADLSASERSILRLQALAQVPFQMEPEPEIQVRAPGPIWRETHPPGPRMSTNARAQLLRRINDAAPEDALERVRKAARQPGMSGIAAWRQIREHEKAALDDASSDGGIEGTVGNVAAMRRATPVTSP
jgi:hypothetical protein